MLKLGEKIISDIYLGDKKIAKVFLGDKLVYQANKPIFLDYITFGGASWIDIDYIPTSNTRVVGKCSFTQFKGSGANYVFGVFGGGANFGFNVGSNRGILNVPWGSTSGVSFSNNTTLGQVYSFDISKNGAYIDGVLKLTASQLSQEFTATKSFFVGWANGTGTEKLIGNIYPMQMYESDVLVKDLRPCIDPNGKVCLYDMVTKKYHYDIGIGTLTAGNVIKFVDYIHTDGNSYIDTGIALGINHKVSVKVKAPSSSSSAIQLFGNYSDSAGYFTCNIANSAGAISRFDGVSYTGNISRSDGNFHTYTLDKNGILIDSDTILNWNKTPTDFQQSDSFYLFRARGSSSVAPNGTQISEEKVWENDTLIQHLKPCVVAGEAGFYDMVTGNVFTNAGTGTLKASGRFVESIVFDGASYIDTGITQQTCTIECTVKLENAGYRQFLGGWSHLGGCYIAVDTSNRFELGASVILTGTNATELSNVIAEHTETEMILTVNGNYAKRTIQTGVNGTYWLGDMNSTQYTGYIIGSVYGHKFKNADGTLIQDLRPYVDENGTACFKDIVTGKLFYNQGTGKLEYTE